MFKEFINILNDYKNLLLLLNFIITIGATFYLHCKSKNENLETILHDQLLELQKISLEHPFLEDENYTKQWDLLKEKYDNKELKGEDLDKFIQYDVYTEMLFNFLFKSFDFYKSEKKLLNFVDFESWLDIHAKCWTSPLQPHSNRKVYGQKMFDMVNRWIS